MIESRSRREFEEIMQEKDVIRGLNELDRLVGEAKSRRDVGKEAPAQAYVWLRCDCRTPPKADADDLV